VSTIRPGLIKRIHVNKHVIRSNLKHGKNDPAITVQLSSGPLRARNVEIKGPGRFVTGEKPLSCGARIWFETRAEVEIET
jgi:hypothetical protein